MHEDPDVENRSAGDRSNPESLAIEPMLIAGGRDDVSSSTTTDRVADGRWPHTEHPCWSPTTAPRSSPACSSGR
jgi:hypothetical protein